MHADPNNPDSLRIVHYPAEVLREKAAPVDEVNDTVRAVAQRMLALMAEAEGIGLAAPQIGLPWRMFVADVEADPEYGRDPDADPPTATREPKVYINPEFSDYSRDLEPFEEGCLSLPAITGNVRRPTTVTIRAQDTNGAWFEERASGLLARCWQHENDHLDGVLIIDKMDPLGKRRNKKAIRDLESGARVR